MRRSSDRRYGGPYRARDGIIFGVCRGLARHLNFPVFWLRVIALIALISTGLWPIAGLYLLAAVLMKPEPAMPFQSVGEEEFYCSFASSRIVTARERDWERRFNQ
jgi:phage shock protein C